MEQNGTGRGREALAHQRRLLDDAALAGRGLAPGAPADGKEAAVGWLRQEAFAWLSALRAAAEAGAHRMVTEVAEAVHWAFDCWPDADLWDEVFTLGREAARALGDPRGEAAFLNYAARHHLTVHGSDERARICAAEALLCAQRAGDAEQTAWGRLHVAVALSRTDTDLAVAQADSASAEFERLHHLEGTLRALATTARALSGAGRHDEARPYLRRLCALCSGPVDDRLRPLTTSTLAWACVLDGEALASTGQWEDAERVYRQALADLEPTAASTAEVLLCLGLAGLLRRRPEGGAPQGAALLRRALNAAREANDVQGMTRVLSALDDWAVIAR
ncbi:hypothetical protein [Streptomyces sp. NPDC058371]|uniref:hypothetical protein n=1 Tax=Streptomyces sp. NPDC058371 TaxID=3346463 RepID=UPI00365D736D